MHTKATLETPESVPIREISLFQSREYYYYYYYYIPGIYSITKYKQSVS